ncbi:hypothetical protein GCM10010390_36530 [Streptomyces mordarskii]|uniref:Uncharacterized protein n=1 Tax=Streptomyces mordarskii TaxID=1226758 RepID=A0ABN1D0R4_9ACTN
MDGRAQCPILESGWATVTGISGGPCRHPVSGNRFAWWPVLGGGITRMGSHGGAGGQRYDGAGAGRGRSGGPGAGGAVGPVG